ncbi:hypothetical protein [Streptomyces sp. NPDC094049]|uniref:hypothetical protein n=1 Tax=Streptomyces sp. NPDC094049 TaxID=3154987 RepID=UPI003319F4F2
MYRSNPTGLARLLRALPASTTPAWVITGVRSRHGIVVRVSTYGGVPFRYCGSVADSTMDDALTCGFVTLDAEEPVPEYDEGRGPWRYEEGRTGRPISVTEAGWRAGWER